MTFSKFLSQPGVKMRLCKSGKNYSFIFIHFLKNNSKRSVTSKLCSCLSTCESACCIFNFKQIVTEFEEWIVVLISINQSINQSFSIMTWDEFPPALEPA